MIIKPIRVQFKTACEMLDISRESLRQLVRSDKTFPQAIKIGNTKQAPVYFDYAELVAWHNSQKQSLAVLEAYALKNKKVKNLASLPENEMPEFLRRIKAYPADAQTHHAIILIMLTGVRVSELLQARWDEFDVEDRKWDIPAERMKNGLPHRVPLTDMMIDELQALRLTHNQDLLFPHRLNNKEPMRSESILAVIKRSGYAGRMTTHGFRSLFSTVLNESNLFNPDGIERQLAHVPQNRIRSAYNRAQYWDERVKLMEWYGEKVKEWLS